MQYCTACILPDTRPGIVIDGSGVCNACQNSHQKKQSIDWLQREQVFQEVVKQAKELSHGYDCLIPVSGGKDSTWQVIKCLEYGLNPLAVTWKTPARTKLGQKNLDNLVSLGVDHIDYQVNPTVERKFMLKALEQYGSTAIPMHMAIFHIPLTLAVKFQIPLIVWGENSAFEYGTDEEALAGFHLDQQWFKKFGVTQGTTAQDWVSPDLTAKALTPYFAPKAMELAQAKVLAVFLGYYFPWDPETSLHVALTHGFQVRQEGPKLGYYNYADIDDDFISIHHYLKWYKFGITRTWDNLSLEIRNQRVTREAAIEALCQRGDETPHEDIEKFCAFVGIKKTSFFEIIEKFRNPHIWYNEAGVWKIRDFLIADWNWP